MNGRAGIISLRTIKTIFPDSNYAKFLPSILEISHQTTARGMLDEFVFELLAKRVIGVFDLLKQIMDANGNNWSNRDLSCGTRNKN